MQQRCGHLGSGMGGMCDNVHKIIMELKNSHVLNDNIAITV